MRLPLLLATVLLAATAATGAAAQDDARRITVTGMAEVEVAPDLATLRSGVETLAPTAGAAVAENAALMTAVLTALEAAGVDKADIQTSQLNLSPVYDNRPEREGPAVIEGYSVRNVLTVRVRNLIRLGATIDAMAAAGANRIDSVSFDIADPGPHLDAARRDAVADARARAELLADAAGVTLGPVMTLRESPSYDGPVPMRARAEVAMAMPVAEGAISLGASVEIVYGIE